MLENNFNDLDFNREELAGILSLFAEEIKYKLEDSEVNENLNLKIKDTIKMIYSLEEAIMEPFKIAVVGSQGTGKSTIINLLLGEKLMISHYDETEGSIVNLKFTEDKELEKKACIKYFTDKHGVYREEYISRKEFEELIDLSKEGKLKTDTEYRNSIGYIEIYSRNEKLKRINFVNTPGMNTVTANFLEKVRELFIKADMIIWVNKREQILDNFNTNLVKEIHKYNNNIIGVLGFADDLYLNDSKNGLNDVIKDFFSIETDRIMTELLDGKKRKCFFVYNGLAAESAMGMKPAKLIQDEDEILPGEQASLKMLWNYIKNGFPFSDEGITLLDNYNMWNENANESNRNNHKIEKYEESEFKKWLEDEKLIEGDGSGYIFTDTGKSLLLQSSMLPYIEYFAQEHIFGKTLIEKRTRVKEGFYNLTSKDNFLKEISKEIEKNKSIIESKDEEATEIQKQITILKAAFDSRYKEWYLKKIYKHSDRMSSALVEKVIEQTEKKIGKKQLAKEMLSNLIPKIFRSEKDSELTEIVSKIIEEEIQKTVDEKTESILNEASEEANNIIVELTMGSLEGDKIRDKEVKAGEVNFKTKQVKLKIDNAKLINVLKNMKTKIAKKIGELIKKIAASDMRKKGMNKFKKFFVKLFRNILKKIGVEFSKKQAEKAPTKSIPFVGWVLFAKDLLDTGVMISEMFQELRIQLERSIKENKDDFLENFEEILEPIYKDIRNAIFDEITESLKPDNKESENALKNIKLCSEIEEIFENYKNKFKIAYAK